MRNNNEIINIIKDIMASRDISLSELARRLDIPKSSMSRYLNEHREFPVNRVEEFAKALGTTSEYLLGFSDETPSNPTAIRIAAHIDDDVSEEEMNDILKYIDFIKSQHKD